MCRGAGGDRNMDDERLHFSRRTSAEPTLHEHGIHYSHLRLLHCGSLNVWMHSWLQASEVLTSDVCCFRVSLLCDSDYWRRAGVHLPGASRQHHPGGDDRGHQGLRPRQQGRHRDQGLGPDAEEARLLRPDDGEGDRVLADVDVQQEAEPQHRVPGCS